MTSKEKAELIVQIADDMKAERMELLDVHQKTPIADYFVVCTGTSDIHVRSIVGKIEDKLTEQKVKPLRRETGPESGWLLLDYGDVVVHVMREEVRQFYDLETLWKTKHPDPSLLD